MTKKIRKVTGRLLVVGLLVAGLSTGAKVYAGSIGATGTSADVEFTLEEMLVYAIEDEYLAQAEYDSIMEKYDVQRPFSNIIKAEATHISLLEPLLKEYNVTIPDKDWESLVTMPESLEAAYAFGIEAEEKSISMYTNFLKEELPDEVRDVFERLMNASEKHSTAFQRQLDGVGCGFGNGNGNESGMQKGSLGVCRTECGTGRN